MIRKTLLTLIAVLCSTVVYAAVNPNWYKYPVYCDTIQDVVATANRVYYLSGGNLFSYAPSDQESYAYTQLNSLNDSSIATMHYNSEKDYLLLAYDNSNIDVITSKGQVINLPEIKDANVSTTKTINDVAFGADRIAIATDFGIVVYSDTKWEVIESGIYNKKIDCVDIMAGRLLVYGHYATDFSIMFSPLETRHNSLDKFTKLFGFATREFRSINDSVMVLKENNSNKVYMRKIDFSTPWYTKMDLDSEYPYDSPLKVIKDGCYTYTVDQLLYFGQEGLKAIDIPEQLQGQVLTFLDDPSKVWAGSPQGIAEYDISTSTPTVLHDRMLYDNFTTDKRVCYMNWSADKQRLYISNRECSISFQFAKGEGSKNYQTTNYIDRGKIVDVSLKNATAVHKYSVSGQSTGKNTRMYGDPLMVLEDPDDPDKYYCANYFEGVYVIKRNPQTGIYEEVAKFTHENSTITDNWGERTMWLDIDREGNLWVGHQYGNTFSILPAQHRRKDPATVTQADWVTYSQLADLNYVSKDMTAVICKHSDMVFYAQSVWENGLVAIDTKGTYLDTSDDEIYHWDRFVDQDGNVVNYQYCTYIIEDARGCVWVGTTAGVFEISNPKTATQNSMRVRRIKVPRNDGTNYADYLLDSDMITWIALDPSNRKWIGTESSGLFLVSETGDKVLANYDTSNSPLTSNMICCVECDNIDNTVYVGTPEGLYSFKSDAAPGHSDYSEMYAYPNPVRPEYSGHVTITGLMADSVVKITDTAGNVVYETRSEGGMATWDACGPTGERVPTGVYYVYGSHYNGSTSTGSVTKILVIN